MAVLQTINVSMIYENGFQALTDVSLTINEGNFVTLLGPSGCGKTTLLKLIAGFLTPSSGQIQMHGKDITNVPPEKRDTAMVFQSYALFPHMTVHQNMTFGPKQKRVPKQERNQRADDVLRYVSMEQQRDKYPKALSGGQQQRVALGRALAMQPGIVLFDEPLSNLDAKLREQVRFEIRKLQHDQGFTAIYVTHDQSEALAMSDKIYLMRDGQIEQAGKPHELYTRPRNRFVSGFLGIANTFVAEVVAKKADDTYEVDTPFGVLHATSDTPPVDKRVYMCWRPENAELVSEPNGHTNVIKFRSQESVFLGNVTDIMATRPDTPDVTYRVQLPRYTPLPSGSEFYVALKPQDLYFLEDTV
ncbi:MAG: ABC transporter ATP-binding protein [Chloroflexota bacterium]